MSVDDDWRLDADGDASEPPKPARPRYQLDIDAPLLAPVDRAITGAVPVVGSLSWSNVTSVTGSVDTTPSGGRPVLGDRLVGPATLDNDLRTVPPAPLATLGGVVTGEPDVQTPHGAPIHRATATGSVPRYQLDIDVSTVVPAQELVEAPHVERPPTDELSEPAAAHREPVADQDALVEDDTAEPIAAPSDERVVVVLDPIPVEVSEALGAVDTLAGIPDAPPSQEVDLVIDIDDPPPVQVPASALSLSTAPAFQPSAPAPARAASAPLSYAVDPAYLPSSRRRRKSPVGTFIKLVLLLGVIAGAAYAVKVFVLDATVWPDDIAEVVAEVEEVHGLTFTESVPVEVLPADEYGPRASAWLDRFGSEDWALFGIAPSGDPSTWVDQTALFETPVFYDADTGTIVELADLPSTVRKVAIARALSAALLDQHAGWSAKLADLGQAQVVGLMALVDGAGRNAAEVVLGDGQRAWSAEYFGFAGGADTTTETPSSPYLTAMVGRSGLASQALTAGLQGQALVDAIATPPADDASVFDPAREFTPESGGSSARGMMFWYHVLASRLDAATSWRAATAWRNDQVSESQREGIPCVSARIDTVDAASGDFLTLALQAWASSTPDQVTLERPDAATLTFQVCPAVVQPAAVAGPAVTALTAGVAAPLGGAPVERSLVSVAGGDTPLTLAQVQCLVPAARGAGVPFDNLENAPPLLGLTGWQAPWALTNQALLATCAPA